MEFNDFVRKTILEAENDAKSETNPNEAFEKISSYEYFLKTRIEDIKNAYKKTSGALEFLLKKIKFDKKDNKVLIIDDKHKFNIEMAAKDNKTVKTKIQDLLNDTEINKHAISIISKETNADIKNSMKQILNNVGNGEVVKDVNDDNSEIGGPESNNNGKEFSLDSALSEWKDFGNVLTYRAIEMLSMAADKDTKLDDKTMVHLMKHSFKSEKQNYIDTFVNIDSRMQLDTAKAVIADKVRRGDLVPRDSAKADLTQIAKSMKKAQKEEDDKLVNNMDDNSELQGKTKQELKKDNYEYFKNFVDNMLNEADEEPNDENNGSDLLHDISPEMADAFLPHSVTEFRDNQPGSANFLLKQIEAVKHKYTEDFKEFYRKIEASFDEGCAGMKEKESHDTVETHEDPITGEKQERIGRLGSHGPMTYIKNHPNLEKLTNDIQAQDWNIFNCGAKLALKIFEVIENGSKGLQKMKQEIGDAMRQMKRSMNVTNIPKFLDLIASSEDAMTAMETLALMIASYENTAIDTLRKPTIIVKEKDIEKDGKKTTQYYLDFTKETAQKLINDVGMMVQTQKGVAAYLSIIDKFKGEAKKELDDAKKAQEDAKNNKPEENQPNTMSDSLNIFNTEYNSIKLDEADDDEQKDKVMNDLEGSVNSSEENDAEQSTDNEENVATASSDANTDAEADKKNADAVKAAEDKNKDLQEWEAKQYKFDICKMYNYNLDFDVAEIKEAKAFLQKTLDSLTKKKEEKPQETVSDSVKVSNDSVINEADDNTNTVDNHAVDTIEQLIKIYDLCDSNNKNGFLTNDEVEIRSINGRQFIDKVKNLFNSLNGIKLSEFSIPQVTEELQQIIPPKTSDIPVEGGENIRDEGEPYASDQDVSGDVYQDISDITDISGIDRNNYKDKLKAIEKKADDQTALSREYFTSTLSKEKENMDKYKHTYGTHALGFIHSDKNDLDILERLWVSTVTLNYKELTKLHDSVIIAKWHFNNLIKLNESFDEDLDKLIKEAVDIIDEILPEDINSEKYNMNLDTWQTNEYSKFKTHVNNMLKLVLQDIEETKSDFDTTNLNDENYDPFYKLIEMIGYYRTESREEAEIDDIKGEMDLTGKTDPIDTVSVVSSDPIDGPQAIEYMTSTIADITDNINPDQEEDVVDELGVNPKDTEKYQMLVRVWLSNKYIGYANSLLDNSEEKEEKLANPQESFTWIYKPDAIFLKEDEESTEISFDDSMHKLVDEIGQIVPVDTTADVYKKTLEDWTSSEYKEFKENVQKLVDYVLAKIEGKEEYKDKLNLELLKADDSTLEGDPFLKFIELKNFIEETEEKTDNSEKENDDNAGDGDASDTKILALTHDLSGKPEDVDDAKQDIVEPLLALTYDHPEIKDEVDADSAAEKQILVARFLANKAAKLVNTSTNTEKEEGEK